MCDAAGSDWGKGGLVGFDRGGGRAGLSGSDGFRDESFEGADLTGEAFLVVFDGSEAGVEVFYARSHLFAELGHFCPHLLSEFAHLLPERGEFCPHPLFEFSGVGSHLFFEFSEFGSHLLPECSEFCPHLLFELGGVGAYLLPECGEFGSHLLLELGLAAFKGGHSEFEGRHSLFE